MSEQVEWIPRTKLGKLVKDGKVASIKDILEFNMPIREYQIVDALLPNLESRIIFSGVVQRQTDAGEVNSFKIVTAVGNRAGFVGIGAGKARQLNEAREKSMVDAKTNLTYLRRGCGSWECRCGTQHSVPYKMRGKSGSVSVNILPAPRGTGIVASEIVREVLGLAGVSDAWVSTEGETRNMVNVAYATVAALRRGLKFKSPADWGR
ncbi:MAG: 30S ribosomal protein S5 [Candidatus Marsarchaeota archaeon]|nr:30S ribosomal protein S5 [Candidatus Marsarchaeota archaeon]